jgi:hypothetical protein
MCKKGPIFHKVRLNLSRKQASYSTNDNLSFVENIFNGEISFVSINQLMDATL